MALYPGTARMGCQCTGPGGFAPMPAALVTLSADELRQAAETFEAYTAQGVTTVAAIAHAIRSVNLMRTPAPSEDCVDCQRPDHTCPGHPPTRKTL